MGQVTAIGFDADDTLWHNERFFRMTQERFADLLASHVDADQLMRRLIAAERRNLGRYGYGVKGFVLSMIETAIEVTDEQVPASVIHHLIRAGQEMLSHPIELLPGARDAVAALAGSHRLVLVTKGDLLDQERKLAQSGLGDYFCGVEIVSEKTAPVYRQVFDRHAHGAGRAVMVGNSLKSDVLPMIEAGGWGIHVPHALTWDLEQADAPEEDAKFRVLADLGGLSECIAEIEGGK